MPENSGSVIVIQQPFTFEGHVGCSRHYFTRNDGSLLPAGQSTARNRAGRVPHRIV
jgi:hypothetical protein